jgi:hypothetical protein
MRKEIRAALVKFLRSHRQLVIDELTNERGMVFASEADMQAEVERYLKAMSLDGTWIGTPEFVAAATIFNCPVEIRTLEGGRIVIDVQSAAGELPPQSSALVILLHKNKTHFSALVPHCKLPIKPLPDHETAVCARRRCRKPLS